MTLASPNGAEPSAKEAAVQSTTNQTPTPNIPDRATPYHSASKRQDAGRQHTVSMLLVCAIILSALSLTGTATIFAIHRFARRPDLEHSYVLETDDAVRFDEIVTAIFADDPDFASRCRELLEHGE